MTWYGASVVTVIKVQQGKQDTFPVFEDVFLVEADNRESAFKKAEGYGLELENLDDNLEFKGIPAKRKFLGIRKLRSICNPPAANDLDNSPPENGTEITHSFFEIDNEADLKRFAEGKRVLVSYVDDGE